MDQDQLSRLPFDVKQMRTIPLAYDPASLARANASLSDHIADAIRGDVPDNPISVAGAFEQFSKGNDVEQAVAGMSRVLEIVNAHVLSMSRRLAFLEGKETTWQAGESSEPLREYFRRHHPQAGARPFPSSPDEFGSTGSSSISGDWISGSPGVDKPSGPADDDGGSSG
jgi:hypothetical protein